MPKGAFNRAIHLYFYMGCYPVRIFSQRPRYLFFLISSSCRPSRSARATQPMTLCSERPRKRSEYSEPPSNVWKPLETQDERQGSAPRTLRIGPRVILRPRSTLIHPPHPPATNQEPQRRTTRPDWTPPLLRTCSPRTSGSRVAVCCPGP